MDNKSSIALLLLIIVLSIGVWYWFDQYQSEVGLEREAQLYYHHPEFGFSLQLPNHWSAEDRTVEEVLVNGRYEIRFYYQVEDQDLLVFTVWSVETTGLLDIDGRPELSYLAETEDRVFLFHRSIDDPVNDHLSGDLRQRLRLEADLVAESFSLDEELDLSVEFGRIQTVESEAGRELAWLDRSV